MSCKLRLKDLDMFSLMNRTWPLTCDIVIIIFIQISVMKSELQDLQPMLVSRSEETEALAKVIEAESKEVALVREVVEKDEAAANEAAMSSKNIKVCSN